MHSVWFVFLVQDDFVVYGSNNSNKEGSVNWVLQLRTSNGFQLHPALSAVGPFKDIIILKLSAEDLAKSYIRCMAASKPITLFPNICLRNTSRGFQSPHVYIMLQSLAPSTLAFDDTHK